MLSNTLPHKYMDSLFYNLKCFLFLMLRKKVYNICPSHERDEEDVNGTNRRRNVLLLYSKDDLDSIATTPVVGGV